MTVKDGAYTLDDLGEHWTGFNDFNTAFASGTNALSINSSINELMVWNENGLFVCKDILVAHAPVYTSAMANLPADVLVHSISNNGTAWYLATNKGVFTSASASFDWIKLNTHLTLLEVYAIVPFKTGLVCGVKFDGILKQNCLLLDGLQ